MARSYARAYRVYDLLTDQLVGEMNEPTFARFVTALAESRKDHGGMDGTAFGFPDRTIYVPDAWDRLPRRSRLR